MQPRCVSYVYIRVENTFSGSSKLHFSLKSTKPLSYSWLQVTLCPSCWSLVAQIIWFTTKKHRAWLLRRGLKQILANNSTATPHLWRWLILHAEQPVLIKCKVFTSSDLIKDQGITSFTTIIHSTDFYVAGLTLSQSQPPLNCCDKNEKRKRSPRYAVFTQVFYFPNQNFLSRKLPTRDLLSHFKKAAIHLIYR